VEAVLVEAVLVEAVLVEGAEGADIRVAAEAVTDKLEQVDVSEGKVRGEKGVLNGTPVLLLVSAQE
jgi:hypothetical protein